MKFNLCLCVRNGSKEEVSMISTLAATDNRSFMAFLFSETIFESASDAHRNPQEIAIFHAVDLVKQVSS